MTLGSKVNILNICLIMSDLTLTLILFMEGYHNWHNDCLWCVNDNEDFGLPIRSWSQRLRSTVFKISLLRNANSS